MVVGKSIHPWTIRPPNVLIGLRTTLTGTNASCGGFSSMNAVPVTSHCEPTPNVLLLPLSVMRVFASRATFHSALPVVSCLSYSPSALRMNPPRTDICASGAWSPICQQTASMTCLPGCRSDIS